MKSEKRLSLIINLTTVFVLVGAVLVSVYIYREQIFGFSVKNEDKSQSEPSGIPEITSQTPPPIDFEDQISAPVSSPTDLYVYIEAPMSDFMQQMFDAAIELPDSTDKIEPPPKGRSLEQQYGAVPLSEQIPEPFEYFKNIVLLGDSVTAGFDLFREKIMFGGEAVLRDLSVVAVGSYGAYNAIQPLSENSVHPLLNGEKRLPEDIIAAREEKNVIICLGLNDLVWQKPEHFVIYYTRLIDRIKEKSPGKNIAIASVTPCVAGQRLSALDNATIAEANDALLDYARENGIYFIDYGAAVRDSENNLFKDFSSDEYTHLTIPAYERLVEYMLYHPIK
ncbi:MAG: SGNH/GDSL hydrolase family protein [Oscillospiraceae bacterium]|nr:SGNH/GDSL hydrolase family protein [Oscillospiraceae bacterium]